MARAPIRRRTHATHDGERRRGGALASAISPNWPGAFCFSFRPATVTLDGSACMTLTPRRARTLLAGTDAGFVASGHLVFWREGALWAVRFDPDLLEVTGPPGRRCTRRSGGPDGRCYVLAERRGHAGGYPGPGEHCCGTGLGHACGHPGPELVRGTHALCAP